METTCAECGKALGQSAIEGLCPECLIRVGLGSQVGGGLPEAGSSRIGARHGFTPPSLEELAPHFPQLEILTMLGKGGMGAVFKARQKGLNRLVALKVLSPEAHGDAAFAERFTREGQALARLGHPNIVAVHEFGQAGGFYYLVMEFVDGLNLRQMLQSHRLSPREAMAVVPQICEALQFAHEQGIVHRDIKPENILLDKQGRVKIADFGLAKLLGKDPQGDRLTRSAEVMGTPHYMAPEQWEKPLEVDHRADIYSVGVVFYEMLTGELPLGRFALPSKKVQIDVRLDEIVLRALEKEPSLRYQQASALKTMVETISTSAGNQVRPEILQPPIVERPVEVESQVARMRRQVLGPAVGLFVSGILICGVLTLVVLLTLVRQPQASASRVVLLLSLSGVALGGFLIYAGTQMMRLKAYGCAVGASVIAILLSPMNLLSLPMGVWALVVLSRGPVREAFRKEQSARSPRARLAWKLAGASIVLLMGGFLRAFVVDPYYGDGNQRSEAPAFVPVSEQVAKRLRSQGVNWTGVVVDLLPNDRVVWRFRDLSRRPSPNEAEETLPPGMLDLARLGGGMWRAKGQGSLASIEFDVERSESSSSETNLTFGFGVETFRDLLEFSAGKHMALDLDTGEVRDCPTAGGWQNWDQIADFLRSSGTDIIFEENGLAKGVSGVELAAAEVKTNLWDAPAETIRELIAQLPPPRHIVRKNGRSETEVRLGFAPLDERDGNGLFLFRTREGAAGLLQIRSLANGPRRAKLRFKVLERAPVVTAPGGQLGARVLYFPADRSLGTLFVRGAHARWDYPQSWTDWSEFSPARGRITIPAGQDVRLDVSPEGVKDLSPLASLAVDDLASIRFETGRADDMALRHIGRQTGLKALHATLNQVTDRGLGYCSRLTNLLDLHLNASMITDAGLKPMLGLTRLEHLSLDQTAITDEGLQQLGKLSSLKDLSLMQTALRGAELAQLAGLTNLQALYLCNTGTDNQALERAPSLLRLERLSLKGTQVTDAGLASLNRYPALRHLDLERTRVTDAGISNLTGMKSLEDLLLPDSLTDAGIQRLDGMPALKTLALTRTKATGRCLQSLRNLPDLKALLLPPDVRDDDLAHLRNFPLLEELWIQNSPVTDDGLRHLKVLRGLKRLFIKNVPITDAGYGFLRSFPMLEYLSLRDQGRTNQYRSGIGDEGLAQLAALTRVRHLDLARSRVTDRGLAALAGMSNLETLDLSETRVTGEGLMALRGLRKLRQLRLKDNDLSSAGVQELSALGSLELVQLQGSRIASADLLRLQAAFSSSRLAMGTTQDQLTLESTAH